MKKDRILSKEQEGMCACVWLCVSVLQCEIFFSMCELIKKDLNKDMPNNGDNFHWAVLLSEDNSAKKCNAL